MQTIKAAFIKIKITYSGFFIRFLFLNFPTHMAGEAH